MANKLTKLYEQKHNPSLGDSPMAKLLAKKSATVSGTKKADVIKGTITKLTRAEILVDIKGKAEALVLEKDKQLLTNAMNTLAVGDVVNVTILNPESDNGNAVVSLRRHMEHHSWEKLGKLQKDQEAVEVVVTDVTKGGYLVRLPMGLSGFLPFSHVAANAAQQPSLGKSIQVFVFELQRDDNKIVVSQKHLLSDDEFALVTKAYSVDQKIQTTISGVTSFGLFVTLPYTTKSKEEITVDGLIHISELSWERVADISANFKVGESIEAVVIGFDRDAKRVDLSIKRLSEDPFAALAKKYTPDTKVQGTVSKIVNGNVHVFLEEGIEGVIKKEKVPPTVAYKEGQEVTVLVSDIDKRHRTINLVPHLLKKTIGYR